MCYRYTGIIASVVDAGIIKNQRVYEAMMTIDRGLYAPRYPYEDSPQTIGTNSLALPMT